MMSVNFGSQEWISGSGFEVCGMYLGKRALHELHEYNSRWIAMVD